MGTAAIVIAATTAGGAADARAWVYRAAAGLLVALATLTALTGSRTAVVWFKICPVVLGGGAGLLLAASWLLAQLCLVVLGGCGWSSGLGRARRDHVRCRAGRGEEAAEDFADAGRHARLVLVGQGQHRPVQPVQEKPGQHAGVGGGERALVHRLAEQAGDEVPQRLPGLFLVSWGLVE